MLISGIEALFARDWAGLVLAGVVALAGLLFLSPAPTVGWILLLLAVLLAVAAVRYLLERAGALRANPAPGRLVDIGGTRIHLLAEGPAAGPAIVWLGGAHSGGHVMHHLHRRLSPMVRSILIDRPGTGWSDIGPFPRTTVGECRELVAALDAAGEAGPFIWAGHSYGGLLAANIARRHPDRTHSVALLDATPPDTILRAPKIAGLKAMARQMRLVAVARMFGLSHDPQQKEIAASPAYSKVIQHIEAELGAAGKAGRAIESNPGYYMAGASILTELDRHRLLDLAWDIAPYHGDLDGIPVHVIGPGATEADLGDLPEFRANPEQARMARVMQATRESWMLVSNRAERHIAPPGTGHNFIYEAADWTADTVRAIALGKSPP
jgi:pimeloyl-ACP methyl ester carboxylesterase